jgi:methylmalonyl-CoA mutase cobalamin-binding subunit
MYTLNVEVSDTAKRLAELAKQCEAGIIVVCGYDHEVESRVKELTQQNFRAMSMASVDNRVCVLLMNETGKLRELLSK